MRNSLYLVLFVAACGGTDPSISGVFPAEGFTGRSLRVEVSGDATEWSGTPQVDFGEGVTVSSVTLASPTSLFADIVVADTAAIGLRDVVVRSGDTYTLSEAFLLKSPIEFQFQGTAAQGSIPYFKIINHDFSKPFDVTTDDSGAFVNLQVSAPSGMTLRYLESSAYQLSGYAFIDVDTTPGPFSIVSGPIGNQVTSNLGVDLDIQARTPLALTDMATGTLASVGDSALYAIDASAAPALVRAAATTTGDGDPVTALLGPSGRWSDAIGSALAIQPTAGTVYLVVYDAATGSGYEYTVSGVSEKLTSAAEGDDVSNGTTAGALVASAMPFQQTGGTLSGIADVDMIEFTVSAANAGKRLHIIADSADGETDTVVNVIDGSATSFTGGLVDEGGCFTLFGLTCGENVISDPLPEGTYYIEISAGAAFLADFDAYDLYAWFE